MSRAETKAWFAVHSKTNSAGHARLGMTVSKRIIPAATQRNIAKRLIRECFRKYAHQGMALDIVIRLRKPFVMKDLPAAKETLGEMIRYILVAK